MADYRKMIDELTDIARSTEDNRWNYYDRASQISKNIEKLKELKELLPDSSLESKIDSQLRELQHEYYHCVDMEQWCLDRQNAVYDRRYELENKDVF
jgi:hypothetical protein